MYIIVYFDVIEVTEAVEVVNFLFEVLAGRVCRIRGTYAGPRAAN